MATPRHLLVDPVNKRDYQPVLSGLDGRPAESDASPGVVAVVEPSVVAPTAGCP